MNIIQKDINGVDALILGNEHLRVSVVPEIGGRIISVFNKLLKKEFLWTNGKIELKKNNAGEDYDPNFYGGIDELIPNDIPENIDGIDYPDHGELWTTALAWSMEKDKLVLNGSLPLSGLNYSKTISLRNDMPVIDLSYNIINNTGSVRHFMWKLHAALKIEENDRLITSAEAGQVVDPAYSRFKKELSPFNWPFIENTDASLVPAKNGTVDFFYLFDTKNGEMQLASRDDHLFGYIYDRKIFPYEWWFASYGGLLDHYTAVLEPCTNMPIDTNEAIRKGQSAVLQPGESLSTTVTIFAGTKTEYNFK